MPVVITKTGKHLVRWTKEQDAIILNLDNVWNDPFKNPEDVDKILEQWRKHKTNLKKEPLL
jgi:hypothetical protein